uniref:UPF0172 protein n=1 Tax=Pararge aegeria TaxID=116150 RepID=S4PTA5_9NEOP
MGEVSLETSAYAKIILHAAKYPHCAVNGVLLADGSKVKSGNKNQELDIVDSIPLFHHSHYVSPMAEIALTQIELQAQSDNRVIAGYYAACENFRDNTVEKCPGQKIAEKIVEYFPSAVFIVVAIRGWYSTSTLQPSRYISIAKENGSPKMLTRCYSRLHTYLRQCLIYCKGGFKRTW